MENINKIDDFLNKAGVCYLATATDGKPHCRPIGFHLLRGEYIYFIISNNKDVYRQLLRNPYAEIVASEDQVWMRYHGTVVFEEDGSRITQMLEAVPSLREKYGDDAEEKLAILHLEDAVCEFRRMTTMLERFEVNGTNDTEAETIVRKLNMTRPDKLRDLIAAHRFRVWYQPQYDLKMRAICGAEALVRFLDEDGNIVPPGAFIPDLEAARVIDIVDFYVFEHVCRRVRKRMQEGASSVIISSNFSKHTMATESFVERLVEISDRYGVPRRLVAVEVTETAEADNRVLFLKTVKKLHENGFRVAIDDFGVMGANMRLLTEVDYDMLKIDKSIVDSVHLRNESKVLVSALISACHHIGARVLAEGVESHEQLDSLLDVKCDAVQGYIFGKPMPEDAFEDLLRAEPAVPEDWIK